MRSKNILTVSTAFAFCVVLFLGTAQAKAMQNASTATNPIPASAQAAAAQMVPAQAVLETTIDAKKMKPGEQIRAKLIDTVQLKNGVELPKDTALVGIIATDKMKQGGPSTLALRFTQADVNDGKVIPIQAAIMGTAEPDYSVYSDYMSVPAPSAWNGKTLRFDGIGIVSGFDLHSRIAGRNSAVLVSTKKDNLTLDSQTQLSLALGT